MSSHTFTRKASKAQFEESERRKAESEARIAAWQAETLKALNDQLQAVRPYYIRGVRENCMECGHPFTTKWHENLEVDEQGRIVWECKEA